MRINKILRAHFVSRFGVIFSPFSPLFTLLCVRDYNGINYVYAQVNAAQGTMGT